MSETRYPTSEASETTATVDAFNAAGHGVLVPWALVDAFDGDYLCAVAYKRLLWRWRQGGGVEREGHHWVAASWTDVAKDLHVSAGQARRAMELLCEKGALVKGGPWRFGMSPVNHYRPDLARLAEYANPFAESDESIRSEPRDDSLKNANHRQSSTSEQYASHTDERGQDALFADENGGRARGNSSTKANARGDPLEGFDEWYAAYPRKAAKTEARTAFVKARAKTTLARLIAGAKQYRDDPNRDPEYTKQPATWLNKGCWDDDPLPERRSNGAVSNGYRVSESGRMRE